MSPPKKYTVLLVDDDKFLLNMYKKKFETSGATVDVAVSADVALRKLRDGAKPDILILDIVMPNVDGIELLKMIREEKLASSSVVVMLTNESDMEKLGQAKTLNVDGYIVKASSIPSEVVGEVLKIAKMGTNVPEEPVNK